MGIAGPGFVHVLLFKLRITLPIKLSSSLVEGRRHGMRTCFRFCDESLIIQRSSAATGIASGLLGNSAQASLAWVHRVRVLAVSVLEESLFVVHSRFQVLRVLGKSGGLEVEVFKSRQGLSRFLQVGGMLFRNREHRASTEDEESVRIGTLSEASSHLQPRALLGPFPGCAQIPYASIGPVTSSRV